MIIMSRKSIMVIVLIILIIGVMLYDRFYSYTPRNKTPKEESIKLKKRLNLDLPKKIDQFVNATPTPPVSFGYKTQWLAGYLC